MHFYSIWAGLVTKGPTDNPKQGKGVNKVQGPSRESSQELQEMKPTVSWGTSNTALLAGQGK